MAETDKDVVAGEVREPGFYWVHWTGDKRKAPFVAQWVQRKVGWDGWWNVPGTDMDSDNHEITVLSPRLEPPK